MQDFSVLKAKIRELEEAYRAAVQQGQSNEAGFWNAQVLHHLLVLSAAVRDSKTDLRTDSGEQ